MSGGKAGNLLRRKLAILKAVFSLLIREILATGRPKGAYDFGLKVDKSAKLQVLAGKKVKAVTLTAMSKRGTISGARTNKIRVYYLPYAKNRRFSHRLVDDVEIVQGIDRLARLIKAC